LNAIGDVRAPDLLFPYFSLPIGLKFMKIRPLLFAALMAVAPSALMATPPVGYGDFDLTKAEINEVIDATNASCQKKSDDTSSVWAAEPRYQAACRNKLVAGSETKMNTAYKRALAQIAKSEQSAFRTEQGVWIKQRYEECRRDRNANLGGALRNVVFADCQLVELKRRRLWIGQRA
jgi:uncharacterized protein YecT (DUF1311 family)